MNLKKYLYCYALSGLALALTSCSGRPAALEAATEPPESQAAVTLLDEPSPVHPADRGSQMLQKLLAPAEKEHSGLQTARAPQRRLARDLREPDVLPATNSALPQLPLLNSTKSSRPADLVDALPLGDQFSGPHLPEAAHLPVRPRLRTPSPDVNSPAPLPFLAQPMQDRAGLDDPTLEASTELTLVGRPPQRAIPIPFTRFVLPNPFENQETGRLRREMEEDSTPVVGTPSVPKK